MKQLILGGMLEDLAIPFADSCRISAMSRLHTKLHYFARKRYDAETLRTQFSDLEYLISTTHKERLKIFVEKHFRFSVQA